MIETIAAVATAVGVLFAAGGIWFARMSLVADFEQSFTERYRQLTDDMPIEFLRNGSAKIGRKLDHSEERAFRLYLELCEDELYFRKHGRISSSTWVDWWSGISNAVKHPELAEMIAGSGRQLELLRAAEPHWNDPLYDPANLWLRRWTARRVLARRQGDARGARRER